jgi:hypothetical protein
MWIIRAVAIGRATLDTKFDQNHTNVSLVRPYIGGLVEWLALAQGQKATPETDGSLGQYTLGRDYEIDYRERDVQQIQDAFTGAENADVLFCMSTYVGAQALTWRETYRHDIPIVVITSNPSQFDGKTKICGVSALRPQLASVGIRKFKQTQAQANLTLILLLNRKDYDPSEQAKKSLGSKSPPVKLVNVKDTDDPEAVVSNLRSQVPANEVHGLFVLPADRFFGWAREIQAAADASGKAGSVMRTFWSTTDWPMNSYGGYGYPQSVCGRYMAERVASIWVSNTNQVPDPAFVTVDPGEIRLKPPPRSMPRRGRRAARGPLRKKK